MKIKHRLIALFVLPVSVFVMMTIQTHAAADNVSYDILYKGQLDTLILTRHSLRAAGFKVKIWNVDHYEEFAVASPSTYRGYLQGHPEITVLARVSDSGLEETAVVRYDGVVDWFIESVANLSAQMGVSKSPVYTITEVEPETKEYQCGFCKDCSDADNLISPVEAPESINGGNSALKSSVAAPMLASGAAVGCGLVKAQIGLDADFAYCSKYGNDVQAVVDRLEWMMEQVDAVYTRDILVTYEISGMMIRNTEYYDPSGDVLGDFTSEWSTAKSTNNPVYPEFDFAHLLTERDTPGIAGLAYMGWSSNGGYGWSKDWAPIIVHEMGHNWGANHCLDPVEAPYLNNHECGGGGLWIAELNKDTAMWYKDRNSECLEPIDSYDTPLPPYAHTDRAAISKLQLDAQQELIIDVIANDHDANCDPIVLSSFDSRSSQGGIVERSVGTGDGGQDELIYTPPADFAGHDMFSYIPLDITGQSGLGVVKIDVSFPDMVGYWPLDEVLGANAHDVTSYGNNGTCQGDGELSFDTNSVAGHFNNALQFTADNQYVDIKALDVQPPWTTSMWVKRQNNTNSSSILMRSSSYALKLEQWPSTGKVGITKFGASDHSFNYIAPMNTWVNLVFVGGVNTTSLYVNGSFKQTINVGISAPMSGISAGGDQSLRAAIDDVRVFSYALPASDIQQLFQGGSAVAPNPGMWARNVSPLASLSWKGNPNAIDHDIYFGTDQAIIESATTDSSEYMGRQTTSTFTPAMIADTTYFWRIDQILPGDLILTGPAWRFNTSDQLLSGMISYLPFENNTLDYSGNLRGGTPHAEPKHVAGKVGNALDINNDGQQYVRLDGEAISPPWTISTWVKRESDTGSSAVLFSGGGYSLRLEQWNNTNKVGLTQSYVGDYTFNYSAPIGQWTHLVFSATQSATSLYANGSYVGSLSVASNLPLQQIGNSGSDKLDAVVDETAAWNRVLTSSEIQTLYTMGINGDAIMPFNSSSNLDPVFLNDPFLKSDALETVSYSDSLDTAAEDEDLDDVLIFNMVDGPEWLSVTPDGQLSGTPGQDDVGQNEFTVRVTDGNGGEDAATMRINVQDLFDGSWGLSDFANFAKQWDNTDCGICVGADLNGDGNIDMDDMVIHAEKWLSGLLCTLETIHVDSVATSIAAGTAGRKKLAVIVIVHDNCGNPVEGATVTGTFADAFTEQTSSITDSQGISFMVTNGQLSNPSFSFCVDDIAHPSMIYVSEYNIENCNNY